MPGLAVLADRRPLPRARRRRGARRRARAGAPRVHRGGRRRRPAADPLRPRLRRRPRADPGAAADRGGAQPSGPHRPPHPGRPGHRDRRVPRGAPPGAADRLRRRGGQPVSRLRVDRGPRRPRRDHRHHAREGGRQLHEGAVEGRAQGDVEDGHLDDRVLLRGAGVRGVRARAIDVVDEYFPGTRSRLGGVGLDVLADEAAARHASAYPLGAERARAPPARDRRRVPVAARGRAAPVQPRDGLPAAARDPAAPLRGVHRVRPQGRGAQPRRRHACAGCSSSAPASVRRCRSTRSSRSRRS